METEESADRILRSLRLLVSESDELLKATVGEFGDKDCGARARLQAAASRCKTVWRELEKRAIADAKAAGLAVRLHPYESAGIAFGIGVLLGLVLTRNLRATLRHTSSRT